MNMCSFTSVQVFGLPDSTGPFEFPSKVVTPVLSIVEQFILYCFFLCQILFFCKLFVLFLALTVIHFYFLTILFFVLSNILFLLLPIVLIHFIISHFISIFILWTCKKAIKALYIEQAITSSCFQRCQNIVF